MKWLPWRGRLGEAAGPPPPPESDARRLGPLRVAVAAPTGPVRPPFGRRLIKLAVVVVVSLGAIAALVGSGGVVDARRLKRELKRLERDVAVREAEVSELREEVARLSGDPLATERLAREDLGYVLPGEIDFLLPRSMRDAPDVESAKPTP